MKKFLRNFWNEYSRVLSIKKTSNYEIDSHFYIKNGVLVYLTGVIALLFVGYFLRLFGNNSYAFYGINVVLIVTIFIFLYSRELFFIHQMKETYHPIYGMMSKFTEMIDKMLYVYIIFFVFLAPDFFSGIEAITLTLFIVLYFAISTYIKKGISNVFIIIPGFLLMSGFVLLLEETNIFIQLFFTVLFTFTLLFMKEMIIINKQERDHHLGIIVLIALTALVISISKSQSFSTIEGEVRTGFQFHKVKNDIVGIENLRHNDKYLLSYEEVSINETDDLSDFEMVFYVYDTDLNEVKSFVFDTEDDHQYKFVNSTTGLYLQDSYYNGETTTYVYYDFNEDLMEFELEDNEVNFIFTEAKYRSSNYNNDYVYFDMSHNSNNEYIKSDLLLVYKKTQNGLQKEFTLNEEMTNTYQDYRIYNVGDYFLFYNSMYSTKGNIVVFDKDGEIVSGYGFSYLDILQRSSSSKTYGPYITCSFADQDDHWYFVYGNELMIVDSFERSSLFIYPTLHNHYSSGLLFVIIGLIVPSTFVLQSNTISKKEWGEINE